MFQKYFVVVENRRNHRRICGGSPSPGGDSSISGVDCDACDTNAAVREVQVGALVALMDEDSSTEAVDWAERHIGCLKCPYLL